MGREWLEMAIQKNLLSSHCHVVDSHWIYGVGEAVDLWVKPFLNLNPPQPEENVNDDIYDYYTIHDEDDTESKVDMRNQIVVNLVTAKILLILFAKSWTKESCARNFQIETSNGIRLLLWPFSR